MPAFLFLACAWRFSICLVLQGRHNVHRGRRGREDERVHTGRKRLASTDPTAHFKSSVKPLLFILRPELNGDQSKSSSGSFYYDLEKDTADVFFLFQQIP